MDNIAHTNMTVRENLFEVSVDVAQLQFESDLVILWPR